jgi:hypothetical protein
VAGLRLQPGVQRVGAQPVNQSGQERVIDASLVFDIGSHLVSTPGFLTQGSRWLIAVGLVGALAAALAGFLDLAGIPAGTRAFRTACIHMVPQPGDHGGIRGQLLVAARGLRARRCRPAGHARAVDSQHGPAGAAAGPGQAAGPGSGSGKKARRRRHAESVALGAGWVPTSERFRDPTSGTIMRVWLDPADQSRHYVPDTGRD